MNKIKRKIIMLKLLFAGDHKRAKILKKHKVFKEFGEGNYFCPFKIPTEPQNIKIHNNVYVTSGVSFITHDISNAVLSKIDGGSDTYFYQGDIEIFDNCMIGANSILMFGITIGPNSIVGAGSVVTKSVPPNSVVAGNPARVICSLDEFIAKRSGKKIK